MNNSTILTLMKSAECKSAEDIRNYAKACTKLDIIKIVDNQMVVNMRSVTEITDYIIQGSDPEIISYVKGTYCKESNKPYSILSGFKFKSIWRKVQSEWGRIYPYLKILTNGMYIPFNGEVLDCTLELLESFNDDVLMYNEALEEMIAKCRKIPYIEVLEVIKEELGIN